MASVVDSIVQPDESAIKAHLELLFAPLREEYPGGLIEIIYGAKPDKASYFNMREDGIADAVAFAASRNRAGENIYVGVNPRKPGTSTRGRASDKDVEIAIWQFADIDKAEALQGLGKALRPLPPFFTHDTGTKPHRRPHLYWRLDEPVWNMPSWIERQRGIAHALGGDAVINPSRIMRIAGGVNFPTQDKLQRGYAVECTRLKTEFDDEREPVSPDEVAAAFSPLAHAAQREHVDPETGEITIERGETTLSAMARGGGVRPADYIGAILAGDSWHNHYRDLVAHWVDAGWTDAEILLTVPALTLPGFTEKDTHRDVMNYIRSARMKFNVPEPDVSVAALARPAHDFAPTPWSCIDPRKIPPREWLFGDIMVRRFVSLLVAPPGAGKSLFTIEVAVALALKRSLGPFKAHEQANVWIFNNEDPRDELDRRISATLIAQGIAPSELAGRLFVDSGEEHEMLVATRDAKTGMVIRMPVVDAIIEHIKRFNIGLFIVDPFVETHAVNENNNDEINRVGRMFREIAQKTGCAVWLVHHTRKTPSGAISSAPGDADAGRGAGSLGGVARFSATIFPMSEKDAEACGVPDDERHLYVRFDDAKANLKLKTNKASWWVKETIDLENGTGLRESDKVGVLRNVEFEIAERKEAKRQKQVGIWNILSAALIAVFEGESMTLNKAAKLLLPAAEPHNMASQRSVERFLEDALETPQRVGAWEIRLVSEARKGGTRWIDRRLSKGWDA